MEVISNNLHKTQFFIKNTLKDINFNETSNENNNNNNKNKYSDEIIYMFLNKLIQNYDLIDEAKNMAPLNYLEQIYSKIYGSVNINWIDYSLQHRSLPRFFNDVLHAYLMFKDKNIDSDLQTTFFNIVCDLYMDRCDINYRYKIELNKDFESSNLDIYNQLYNTKYEINLMSFFENDGEVDYEKRNDLNLLKKLMILSTYFHKIGHDVYYMCSNIKKNDNGCIYWCHHPVKYNEEIYNEIMTSLEDNKLFYDVIQIFLQVDFMYA